MRRGPLPESPCPPQRWHAGAHGKIILNNTDSNIIEDVAGGSVSRRSLIGGVAATGFGIAAIGFAGLAQASDVPKQPEADSGHDYPMPAPHAKTEKEFRMGVIGPAMLSLATSKIAVDKASDPAAKEFANFELREAIGVTTVLKSMNTPVPPMDANARTILKKIQTLPPSAEFDKAYMTAQLANHEFLRDLATVYLKNSEGHASMAEQHGRHLAILTLGAFKEHVVHCKDFLHGMKTG